MSPTRSSRRDRERGIIAPIVGIADLGREVAELVERLFALRLGRHPGQRLDVGLIGFQEIGDETCGLGFGFGREIFGDIELAERIAHLGVEQMHAAQVARQLRRSGRR